MEFVVSKDNLNTNIGVVKQVTTSKSIQPILSNILIETVDNKELKLSATDNDIFVQTKLPTTILKEGKISLNAKILSEIISKMPDENITVKVDEDSHTSKITCRSTVIEMVGTSYDEFPKFPKYESDFNAEIDLKSFLDNIKQTAFAAASYESTSVLSGVYIKIRDGLLEMAATDGSRLALKTSKNATAVQEVSAIVPARTLNEFVRVSTGCNDSKVRIGIDDKMIHFVLKDRSISSTLLEGQYPKYEQLVPSDYNTYAIISREEFVKSLERTSVMASDRTNIVKFVLNNNNLNITAHTPDMGLASDDIDVEYNGGEELKIAFNYKYILDALKVMDTKKIKLELMGSLSPALLRYSDNNDYLCLIMPVQVK